MPGSGQMPESAWLAAYRWPRALATATVAVTVGVENTAHGQRPEAAPAAGQR
jgi:hypothetical protein